MNGGSSLALRLSLNLLAVFVVGSLVVWLAYMCASLAGVAGNTDLELLDFAELPARRKVIASIVSTGDDFAIRPTAELTEQIARMPKLKYAAFRHGRPLAGSAPEMIDALAAFDLQRIEVAFGGLVFFPTSQPSLLPCYLSANETLVVAVCGYRFEWHVLFDMLWLGLQDIFKWSPPVLLVAAVFVWFSVRRGLAPLEAAAEKVRGVDINSLSPRIFDAPVPAEVEPFVTALNSAFERLEAGVARQRRFIANAAHELRTPITALRARIDNPDDAGLRRDLRRYARRLQALSEQLLVSARLAARHDMSEEAVDVAVVVLETVADYLPLVNENGRQIDLEGPLSGVVIRGDRRALQSIFSNLIDNASRAEPPGGTIIVRIRRDARIEILDHGQGVAEADREAIFEAFWRKRSDAAGAGLGLAIVKELVEHHEGAIAVRDTAGGGATFVVDLSSRIVAA